MSWKWFTPERIINKLRAAKVTWTEGGWAWRVLGIAEQTFYGVMVT